MTIKTLAKATTAACKTQMMTSKLNPSVLKFAPTALGLAAIPLIIKPIDNFVDEFMDETYRKYFKI
jgi:fission process protein 1